MNPVDSAASAASPATQQVSHLLDEVEQRVRQLKQWQEEQGKFTDQRAARALGQQEQAMKRFEQESARVRDELEQQRQSQQAGEIDLERSRREVEDLRAVLQTEQAELQQWRADRDKRDAEFRRLMEEVKDRATARIGSRGNE